MIFFASSRVLKAKEPPAAMLRSRAVVMSKPAQKMCKDTSSSKGMLGIIDKRCENLAQAALGTPSQIAQMQECHSMEKV